MNSINNAILSNLVEQVQQNNANKENNIISNNLAPDNKSNDNDPNKTLKQFRFSINNNVLTKDNSIQNNLINNVEDNANISTNNNNNANTQHNNNNANLNSINSSRKIDSDKYPLHSRVFVMSPEQFTEQQVTQLFSCFGNIESCRIASSRQLNGKGNYFLKFSKASEAARAVEEAHNKTVAEFAASHYEALYKATFKTIAENDNAPKEDKEQNNDDIILAIIHNSKQQNSNPQRFRVHIADSKGKKNRKVYSNEPEDTPPRSRLFVVCPKDLNEKELTAEFAKHGSLQYCKVMTDRVTGESKGFAYAKFALASHAAIAMETINESEFICNRKVKILIADPKAKKQQDVPMFSKQMPTSNATIDPMYNMAYAMSPYVQSYPYYGPTHTVPMQMQYYPTQRLVVFCNKAVSQEQLEGLFSRFPGMQFCELKRHKETNESMGCAVVNYSTPQVAYMAAERLNGVEFPRGYPLKVYLDMPKVNYMPAAYGDRMVPQQSARYPGYPSPSLYT